jgi:peptide-methionine (S)-S-oxide reductase
MKPSTKRIALLLVAGGVAIALVALPWAKAEPRAAAANGQAVATFAGGCFWCEEAAFEGVDGVISVTSGYTGGSVKNPTYEQVSAGGTGHREAVEVVFDPKRISYSRLLSIFWRNVDPENPDGQFCDFGEQYRSAIYFHDAEQKRLAEESRAALLRKRKWIRFATDIIAAGDFYPAEEYHQDFYRKNPIRYHFYRNACGRDDRLAVVWRNVRP